MRNACYLHFETAANFLPLQYIPKMYLFKRFFWKILLHHFLVVAHILSQHLTSLNGGVVHESREVRADLKTATSGLLSGEKKRHCGLKINFILYIPMDLRSGCGTTTSTYLRHALEYFWSIIG